MLTIIVATANDRAIGKCNDIPWFAPEDLAMFKRETLGGAVIMGRKTWDSLPKKPLPSRENIVVSSQLEGDHVVGSFAEACERGAALGYSRLYAMGGASIYAEALPLADRLMITQVDLTVEAPDTFFPEYDLSEWKLVASKVIRAEAPACRLMEYIRIYKG